LAHAGVRVLKQIEEPQDHTFLAFHQEYMEHRRQFLSGLEQIDPEMANSQRKSLWVSAILEA
jgi:hypothetical protein